MKTLFRSGPPIGGGHAIALAAALAAPALIQAQVSIYNFSQSVDEYVEVTADDGGYVLGTPVYFPPLHNLMAFADPAQPNGTITNGGYLSPAVGPGYPIGFDFVFNGDVFDRIGVSNGGWISFGKSSDGNAAVWVYNGDHPHARPMVQSVGGPPVPYRRNRVVGFGTYALRQQNESSVGGPVSELRVTTIGTAPERVCVVQWKDFRTNYYVSANNINFQIRLNESDNSVEVRYGPMNWTGFPSPGEIQVGLAGQIPEDFNNRVTVYQQPSFNHDWNATEAGTANTVGCWANDPTAGQGTGPGVYPVVGTTFRWAMPTCAPPAWPGVVSNITYESATVSWNAIPGVLSYDYVVTTENDPLAPAVAQGNTTATSVEITGLDTMTVYHAFVRAVCGSGAGPWWGNSTTFRTQKGGVLVCGEAPLHEYHCTTPYSAVTWHYRSSDGVSPVRIQLEQGYVGSPNANQYFRIHDGANASAPVLFEAGWGDVLVGMQFTSTGPDLFINTLTEQGSCATTEWYTPWRWTVGCKNCTEPLAAYSVVNTDCDALTYQVQVMLISMGDASTINIANDHGVPATTVSTPGIHLVGPFAAGNAVAITLEHPGSSLCNSVSVPLVNEPCAIVDCGPTEYTYCHEPGDLRQWLFQGDGEPIGVRFIGGNIPWGLTARTYNGTDPFSVTPVAVTGQLLNQLRTSSNPDNALLLEASVDPIGSSTCANNGEPEWRFVVACYDGCTQPQATFAKGECQDPGTYYVAVNVTVLGSTGSVTITNDAGVAPTTVTATGVYQVGPFPAGQTVTIDVVGASVLCTWTSTPQLYDCLAMDIASVADRQIGLHPNPSDGRFVIALPEGLAGARRLSVRDLAGRVVFQQEVPAAVREVSVALHTMAAGIYLVEVNDGQERLQTRAVIEP